MATPRNQTQAPKTPIVDKFDNIVNNVQVYSTGESNVRYRLTFGTMFDGIKRDANGDYSVERIDYIDFVPSVLIAQCINHVEGLDTMYTKKKESGLRNDNNSGFGAAELQAILRGAKLSIERTKFEVGDEYTDRQGNVNTHENAGYNTNIVGVKVTERVQRKLDAMFDNIFDI